MSVQETTKRTLRDQENSQVVAFKKRHPSLREPLLNLGQGEPSAAASKKRSQSVSDANLEALKKERSARTRPVRAPEIPRLTVVASRKLSSIGEFYRNCLYDEVYFTDNLEYLKSVDGNFVLRRTYLDRVIKFYLRVSTINFLVWCQKHLRLEDSTLFVATRMFDYVLLLQNQRREANKHYYIVAIVCLWISTKMFDTRSVSVTASQLSSLCRGGFSARELLDMEKTILRLLKFNVNIPEPTSFLYYYLVEENLEDNETVRLSATFLLEITMLLYDFSSSNPSLLAAMCLFLTMKKMPKNVRILYHSIKYEHFLAHIHNTILEASAFEKYSATLMSRMNEIFRSRPAFKNIREKYSNAEKKAVSKNFVS